MSGTPRFAGFDPTTITALINQPVVRQHADDAPFLWGQRDRAVFAPNFRLKDLTRWDQRVEAHLDGLRIAGDYGWELCSAALADEDPGAVFAATVLAFGSGNPARIQQVVQAGVATPELARGLISGLGWLEFSSIESRVADLVRSASPEVRRAGIAAYAVHRQDPGPALASAVSDSDPRLSARAIQAAGELGRTDLLPAFRASLSSPHEEKLFGSAWSAALLGEREDCPRVLDAWPAASEFAEPALTAALRIAPPDRAVKRFRELKRDAAKTRFAAIAAGVIGLPDLVPDLLPLMEDAAAARAAGEAFALLTGVDLEYSDLDGEPLKPAADQEEMPPVDRDEDLPWPSRVRVEAWWKKHRGDFREGTRHVLGRPLDRKALDHALATGTQRQREAAAFELALRDPTRPLFEVRSRGDWQSRRIRSWTS